jgi:alkylhydroperoxidase family enzyme
VDDDAEVPAPRVPPVPDAELDDESRALMEAMGPLNIFLTMANHPKLFKRWMVFGGHVLTRNTLPPRERELVILRVGWACGSDYEFGQHTIIGRREGLTDDEISRIAAAPLDEWPTSDAMLLRATDDLVRDQRIGDATWAALSLEWETQQLMDLVFTVGQYVMTCMALKTFGVQREPGVPGLPDATGGS